MIHPSFHLFYHLVRSTKIYEINIYIYIYIYIKSERKREREKDKESEELRWFNWCIFNYLFRAWILSFLSTVQKTRVNYALSVRKPPPWGNSRHQKFENDMPLYSRRKHPYEGFQIFGCQTEISEEDSKWVRCDYCQLLRYFHCSTFIIFTRKILLNLSLKIKAMILFTQPIRSGRIWHKVNFFKRSLTGFNSRVFLLLD